MHNTSPCPLSALSLTGQCDAIRPSCDPCRVRGLDCHYDVEPGVTRTESLKRKHDAMQTDLEQMRQIYEVIRTSSHIEVNDTVQKIRLCSDPLDVLHYIRKRSTATGRTLPESLPGAATRKLAGQQGNVRIAIAAQACQTCRQRLVHDCRLFQIV